MQASGVRFWFLKTGRANRVLPVFIADDIGPSKSSRLPEVVRNRAIHGHDSSHIRRNLAWALWGIHPTWHGASLAAP
jgi:hypothetical protein